MLPVPEGIRVVKWLDDVSPIPMHPLNHIVSFEDDNPVCSTIYTGTMLNLDRYARMGEYNWRIAFPASIFEINLPLPVSVPSSVTLSPKASTSHGSVERHRSLPSSSRSVPCKFHPELFLT